MDKDMESYLTLVADKVSKNIQVVSKEDLGQDYMLHISSDRMSNKPYIPWIGRRQAHSEDRTVPRITVAPTLFGCYVGYAQLFIQFLNYNPDDKDLDSYRQGLYIHEIEFDQALKPNNKLVYDASRSDEHWLVTYSPETKQYRGKVVGKMFISDVTFQSVSKSVVSCSGTLYIEVNKSEGIRFSKNKFLEKGYYVAEFLPDADNSAWDKDKDINVRPISKAEYEAIKNQRAALLSFSTVKPPFASW